MTLDEMRTHEWSVSWSGGKDSTATIILMHENNIPIKEIVYIRMMYDENTPATLPVMTDFVDGAKAVFESWGYNVRIVKSKRTAIELVERVYKRSKHEDRNGKPYGVLAFMRGHCNFTGVKVATIQSVVKSEYEMIGYAADEKDRLHRLTDTKQSIMAELGVNESDTFGICKRYNLLSPLYDLKLGRDGCWFCPNAGVRERELIKREYPELYHKIEKMIALAPPDGVEQMIKAGRNNWLKDYHNKQITIDDLVKIH